MVQIARADSGQPCPHPTNATRPNACGVGCGRIRALPPVWAGTARLVPPKPWRRRMRRPALRSSGASEAQMRTPQTIRSARSDAGEDIAARCPYHSGPCVDAASAAGRLGGGWEFARYLNGTRARAAGFLSETKELTLGLMWL